MNPKDLLVQLKPDCSEKVAVTLDAIFSVCEDMKKEGVTKFSISAVSKFGAGRGVPKAQSIRNKTGDKYRTLIDSFNQVGSDRGKSKGPRRADAWIHEIEDPAVRTMVLHLAAQLKKANQVVQELQPISEPIIIHDRAMGAPVERLSDLEKEALEYILSLEFQKKMGFKVGNHGDYLDPEGNRVFKIATIDAIRKCIDNLG